MSKRSLALFVLFLLSAVTCVCAIPQDDLPETSYNESDVPADQMAPIVPGIKFVYPEAAEIVLSTRVGDAILNVKRHSLQRKPDCLVTRRDSHSLQDLLCTFLI